MFHKIYWNYNYYIEKVRDPINILQTKGLSRNILNRQKKGYGVGRANKFGHWKLYFKLSNVIIIVVPLWWNYVKLKKKYNKNGPKILLVIKELKKVFCISVEFVVSFCRHNFSHHTNVDFGIIKLFIYSNKFWVIYVLGI
jgi:hypothetical protein